MAGFRSNGTQFSFAPFGQRTDGRQIRPHVPWRVNTGAETANRTVAPGPVTPRTDFSEALRPRLGGLIKPQLDFRVLPSTFGQEQAAAAPLQQGAPQISVPTDADPAATSAPMFGNVTDGTAPAAPTPSTAQDGWITTSPSEQANIADRYGPNGGPSPRFQTQSSVAIGGGSNLPY